MKIFNFIAKYKALKQKNKKLKQVLKTLSAEIVYVQDLNAELRGKVAKGRDFKLRVLDKCGLIGFSQDEARIFERLSKMNEIYVKENKR